ncbi:PhnD/SsuA/transferrin family substrate-binding protein [Shewanella maritima]|uniref:sensor histidine kinase n=1 Tax=Shewanella maritima TaxID=2520507 RepID=UPI00373603E2
MRQILLLVVFFNLVCLSYFAQAHSGDTDHNESISTRYKLKNSQPLNVGVLAFASPERVYQRWAPTIRYVTEATGVPLKLVALTPDELVKQVANHQLDFIIANALISVAFKKDHGASQLLSLIPLSNLSPEHAVGSALIAKKGMTINNLETLTKLKLISSDPNAFGGFQILAGELIDAGINPLTDLKQLKFVGFPQDKLLNNVLNGDADIAILPSCVLEQAIARNQVQPDQLHVLLPKQTEQAEQAEQGCISSSRLYPSYAFSKLGHTDYQTATAITKALLNIQSSDVAAIDGRYLGWSSPVRDDHVFQLLKQLKQWPFITNWQRLLQDITPWILLIAIGLLLGYLHHLRVKRLVVKRTQALRNEMAQHQDTQKELFEQQQQFYRAQRVLLTGEMASGIAHELNQPLAGIRYLTQGCIYRLDDQQHELKTALNKAIEQVDRAQSTIKRFRAFCHQPNQLQSIDITEIINDTLKLMEPDFKRLKLVPEMHLRDMVIEADPSLLQQVIVNLIRNALDAMENTANKRLLLATYHVDNFSHLLISDAGIGLSKDALARLFFPFETTKTQGLGLGMVVCKRIVEEHGGTIQAFRNDDKATHAQFEDVNLNDCGLTFLLSLPVKV